MTLVVLRPTPTGVEKKLCKRDVCIAAVVAFLIVHKSAEAHQSLLHLLVSVEPVPLAGAKVRCPAIGQFFCRIL